MREIRLRTVEAHVLRIKGFDDVVDVDGLFPLL